VPGRPDSGATISRDAASDGAVLADAGASDAAKPAVTAPDASSADAALVDDAASPPAVTDAGAMLPEVDATVPDAGVVIAVDAGAPPAGPPACNASAAPVVGKLGLQTIISNPALESLTDAVQPPDSDDWYLVQETGQVRILRDGQLLPQPFLDLSSEFGFPLGAVIYEDRGLVSIAFAPDYATSGLVYVSFTPNRGAQVDLDLLLEFKRDARDPLKVDVSTRRSILEVAGSRRGSPSITDNIHNGGRVAFGPDGKLYLAMGDGGGINCGDVEPGATQDVGSLFGKLLRLDLSRPAPYGSTDNPFADNGDGRVLHYGLRNPFRFSFDRLTGDLYLGDVGQNTFEEIDFAPAGSKGLNFGWASFEGNSNLTCGRPLRAGSTATAPIFVADRTAVATNPFADYNAMIGGVVYRGSALPQLSGVYFFGGYAGARLGALTQCGSTTSPVTPVTKRCNANTPNEACLRSIDGGPAFTELRAIVEDHAGELYMVANSNSLLKVVALP
jgi:glucose/arabinose dehydrogenase